MKSVFILGASVIWSCSTAIKKLLYQYGILKATQLPARVISVGNFEVGGTGKTPVVAFLANESFSYGFVPVILTRGYRGSWEKVGGVIPPESDDCSKVDPQNCGDEAALLHELVPRAWIGVGSNRVSAFFRVIKKAAELNQPIPNLVILDDGLQHQQIKRDLDLVLMTSSRPWGKIFREIPSQLAQVPRLLIWSKGARAPFLSGSLFDVIRLRWNLPTPSGGPSQSKLWLITGVSDGEEVRRALEQRGWDVVAQTVRRDHSAYDKNWILEIHRKAQESGLALGTTGKDWVKWRQLGVSRESVLVFEPELVFDDEGKRLWLRELWERKY